LSAIPAAVLGWLQTDMLLTAVETSTSPDVMSSFAGFAALSIIVTIVFAYVLQAALTQGAVDDFNGRRADFPKALATGLHHFLPLIAIGLLAAVGFMAGFILLVIPAFILMVMWSVVVPAAVVEKTGVFGAFSRSAELTKGNRWNIFGLLLIYGIVAAVIQLAVLVPAQVMLASAPDGGMFLTGVIITPIYTLLSSMIGGVGVASLYYELRLIKDGVGVDALALIFD